MEGWGGSVRTGKTAGLTLIELLVVMLILSLGWFALLPNLDLSPDQDSEAKALEEVNTMLASARAKAMEQGVAQEIALQLGRKYAKWDDQQAELPTMLSSLQVNGWTAMTTDNIVHIYPEGYMDEVRMLLLNGKALVSDPLAVTMAWGK